MKKTIIFLTLIFSQLSIASICPQSLSFTVGNIRSYELNVSRLSARLELIESSYVSCVYRGVDQMGENVSARIRRNSRRGQTSGGTLMVNFPGFNVRTSTKLKTISPYRVSIDYSSYRRTRRMTPTTIYSMRSTRGRSSVLAISTVHSVNVR